MYLISYFCKSTTIIVHHQISRQKLEEKANAKLSGGAIAGIVVGCVIFAASCVLLIVFLFKERKEERKKKDAESPETPEIPETPKDE